MTPATLNRYAYGNGNPATMSDPSGRQATYAPDPSPGGQSLALIERGIDTGTLDPREWESFVSTHPDSTELRVLEQRVLSEELFSTSLDASFGADSLRALGALNAEEIFDEGVVLSEDPLLDLGLLGLTAIVDLVFHVATNQTEAAPPADEPTPLFRPTAPSGISPAPRIQTPAPSPIVTTPNFANVGAPLTTAVPAPSDASRTTLPSPARQDGVCGLNGTIQSCMTARPTVVGACSATVTLIRPCIPQAPTPTNPSGSGATVSAGQVNGGKVDGTGATTGIVFAPEPMSAGSNSGGISPPNYAGGTPPYECEPGDPAGGFSSFDAVKKALGSPGAGNVYDHIVEQSQLKSSRSGFDLEQIHNPCNLDPVDSRLNQQKANYYASKRGYTGGLTVRDWLNNQPFAKQHEFGLDIMSRLKGGIPLP